jgi:hypothetical protein
MLSRKEFLSLVLPTLDEGEHYCSWGNKKVDDKDVVRQNFATSIDQLSDLSDEIQADNFNSFFALAKFGPAANGRFATNAVALKSFFIDLDCGKGKPYADLNDGLSALKQFCKTTGLPRPTIVKSGRGAHVYWILETPMEKSEWKPHAEQLKNLCATHKFDIDRAVPADAARVLRMLESNHVKDPSNPILCELLYLAPVVPNDKIKALLAPSTDVLAGLNKPDFKRPMDPTTLALMGNYESKFKTILIKSLEGEGCAQMVHIFENQATLEEPLWRAGLSIAQHCSDGEKAIHKISKGHPEYSERITIRKAAETKGPYTCETFKKLNPSVCEGCALKVTSPIQIGREVIATEGEAVVEEVEPETQEVRTYTIPEYPFPFFRGKVGGVYRKGDPDAENPKDELVYPHDFYVVKRVHDPEEGETLWMRLHLPKDGVREFIIPLNAALSKEKFVNAVAQQGMAILGKRQDALMMYVSRWVEQLQSTSKSEIARKQFGWLEDNSAFIVGDREIKATGEIAYSPPTAVTLPLVPIFTPKGDFHVWKDIINSYAREHVKNRAFAFFMGFGGPLMKFVGKGMLDGFLLNLVSRSGGTGKSTLLYAINTIYGKPKPLLLSYKDTHNHRLQRLGTMQSMTPTIDELTDMDPKAMGHLVYDITSGKGKNRMSAKANIERMNNTTWQIPVISSSNRRIKDALLTIKSFPEPELLRILEDDLPMDTNLDPIWSKAHFGRLMENYGHAIDPYVKYIASNLPEVIELVSQINDKVDRAADIKPNERFWSAGVTIAIAGGIISKNLGLHDIPIKPVFNYAVDLIRRARKSNKESLSEGDDYLGSFLQKHFHEILVINGNKDKRTGLEMGAIKEPRGPLTARFEPDTKLLFVLTSAYREECGKRFLGMEDTLLPYKKNGAFLGIKKKRMLAGTLSSAAAGVPALVFDSSKLDFFSEEVFINAENTELTDQD